MKYGKGYAFMHSKVGFLTRTLLISKRTELKFVHSLIKNERGKRILDYGCNSGYYTNKIREIAPNNEIYGADINLKALISARRKYKHIEFYEINNEFFQKNKFDIIIISHVLEHVKDREELMQRLSKILSKNGRIIIVVPQELFRGETTLHHWLYNIIRFRFENPHVVKLSYDDLKKLLNDVGLTIKDYIYSNSLPPLRSKSRKIHSLSLIASASRN